MSSDELSEESSVREEAGYNETFGSSDESEDFSPSTEKEMSAQSPDSEDEREVGMTVMMMVTRRMVTVTRRMLMRNLVKGPQ